MKRTIIVAGIILAVLSLLLQASASVGNAGRNTGPAQMQAGAITIESWLLGNFDRNGLSGTIKGCFKLTGAFTDQGGQPTWTDSTYTDPAAPASKCGDWQPVGGVVTVPGVVTTDTTLYAVHTLTGQKGQISITFSGTYDLINTFQSTSCNWVLTSGTGAYTGVQGEGTCKGDAAGTFPYQRHTDTGQMWRVSTN